MRAALVAIVNEAKAVPCVDCGVQYPPYAMDFDHRGDKRDAVAHMVSGRCSEQTLREEIAKCEVVCANCHRIRTYGS